MKLILLTAECGRTSRLSQSVRLRPRGAPVLVEGPLVLAGGIGDGHALHAAMRLAATSAIWARGLSPRRKKHGAAARYKQMLVDSSADDMLLTKAFTGLQTNMLRPSIAAAGLDPDNLPERGQIDVATDLAVDGPRRWRDIWSAGHSVSQVHETVPVETLVATVAAEYQAALGR